VDLHHTAALSHNSSVNSSVGPAATGSLSISTLVVMGNQAIFHDPIRSPRLVWSADR